MRIGGGLWGWDLATGNTELWPEIRDVILKGEMYGFTGVGSGGWDLAAGNTQCMSMMYRCLVYPYLSFLYLILALDEPSQPIYPLFRLRFVRQNLVKGLAALL